MVTVVYDGGCGMCRAFRRVVAALDRAGRIDWQDLHGDLTDLPVSRAACVRAMQAVDGEAVAEGYDAVRAVCRAVPLLWPAALFLALPGVRWLGDRVYRRVARSRHCTV